MNLRIPSLVAILLLAAYPSSASAQQNAARQRFERMLAREDANKDGKVSKAEFQGQERLFDRLDRNKDGALSADDLAAVRPGPNRTGAPRDVQVVRDVVFGKGGGRDLTMHLVLPKTAAEQPAPVFVWIHGGGWKGGTKDGGVGQCVPMVRRGFVGATIEYRLTGEAPFPAQIEDCKCAIRFLRAHAKKYNIDPDRIAVGGSSAGGHLVALLGTSGGVKEFEGVGGWPDQSSTVQAVIDLYGPTDFKQFVTTPGYERHNDDGSPESALLGGGEVLSKPDGIARVNPITYVDKTDPPFLIIHGDEDATVPTNQSTLLHAALEQAGVSSKLHVIEGAGHGGPKFATPVIQEMKTEFLTRTILKRESPPSTRAEP